MAVHLITIIPALVAVAWALGLKIAGRKFGEALFLLLSGCCVFINGELVYKMIVSDLTIGEHIVQMAACSSIIPLMHMYFSRQLGRPKKYTTIILLWVLAALSFVPNVVISSPFAPAECRTTDMKPFALYVLSSHGERLFAIYMGDLMVMFQTFVVMVHLLRFTVKLHRSSLHFNPRIYVFGAWGVLTFISCVMLSGMTYADLRSTAGEWFYFSVYSFLVVSLNVLIALQFDHYLVRTEHDEAVEDVDDYISVHYRALADTMRSVMEKDKLYLDPMCSAEMLVEKLHTNRTYFSQMMISEFGISFSEYINELRLEHAAFLLVNTGHSVSDIAVSCGYGDSGYMSKKFKEKYGFTPLQYRKNSK